MQYSFKSDLIDSCTGSDHDVPKSRPATILRTPTRNMRVGTINTIDLVLLESMSVESSSDVVIILLSMQCLLEGCGIANPRSQGKVVSGVEATPHQYPWAVAVSTLI